MAESEVVPPLSEGVQDLQQAGADAAPVVPLSVFRSTSGHVSSGRIPWSWKAAMRSSHAGRGRPWGGIVIYTWRPVRWGASVSHCRPHLQPFAAVQLLAQRGCKVGGKHEEQGPLGVAQPGQGVFVYWPPSFEVRHGEPGGPVLRGVSSDGGRVVSPFAYLRSLEYFGGVKDDAGGNGHPDE